MQYWSKCLTSFLLFCPDLIHNRDDIKYQSVFRWEVHREKKSKSKNKLETITLQFVLSVMKLLNWVHINYVFHSELWSNDSQGWWIEEKKRATMQLAPQVCSGLGTPWLKLRNGENCKNYLLMGNNVAKKLFWIVGPRSVPQISYIYVNTCELCIHIDTWWMAATGKGLITYINL